MNLKSFYEVSGAAIDDILEHGFDSKERLERWIQLLASSAQFATAPPGVLDRLVRSQLERTFKREMTRLVKVHPGVSQFTIQNIKPELRAELQRAIFASVGLIKLNKQTAIAQTLQRFAGWASSVPPGGTEVQKRREVKKEVKRGMAGLSFVERRVAIDQSAKLSASINKIVATAGGAIAGRWRHIHQANYNARPEHLDRDGEVFLIRDSWAHEKGFIKAPADRFTDQIDMPAEKIFCQCWMEYLYALRDIPSEFLTAKGKEALTEARKLTA